MNKREIAKETKRITSPNARLQVTKRLHGLGYNAYLTYNNEYFKDDKDEKTIGFIDQPMSIAQVLEWLDNIDYLDKQLLRGKKESKENKPKGQHGGPRPGSGRKPIPLKDRRLQRTFYLNEEDFQKVNKFIDQLHAGKA